MKSPIASRGKKYSQQKGFTIIEILVVIGLVVIVGGLGLFFGLDSFHSYTFHSNKETLVSALQHARSRAVSNICYGDGCVDGKPHGVKIFSDKYVIFQGSDYDTDRDEQHDVELEASLNTSHTGEDEVVFAQLSGDVDIDPDSLITINLTDLTNKYSRITINSEGQILWTN